ncbi:IS1380 family transposase [Chitinilyticum litopenaei]|uniref:IS1380 family transposase n=3 Tax=Chitinilyticum litopenaei TaxID=1121276 RepID=UPI000404BC75|nr:IS1380 family transposase [Chitinilyticum litopenaei]
MAGLPLQGDGFSISFSNREVTAWGGLVLFKQMLDSMGFRDAAGSWGLPAPGSNRGYAPLQLIEQFIVSIWCGACRFAHAETVRMDGTLVRLFGWTKAAGHKAIMRLFARFDMLGNERVQAEAYRWLFAKIGALKHVTLDVDSTVLTRNGAQDGGARGYNPGRRGRASHHPLLAFVAEARMVANFWLRPGNTHSANNILQFLESTLHHLGDKTVGLLRADSGFFDESILTTLEGKRIPYIIAARLTQPLQRTIYQATGWWALETGLELTELRYRAAGWEGERRLIVVRQSVKRKTAAGKTLALFADDPDIQGWRYGAFATSLDLPMAEVWRTYRGRADCENRIKELKADFGLDAFNMRDFWATEAALGFAMLAYNLMSLFRQAVLRSRVQHTLSTLHGLVLAIGGAWGQGSKQNHLMLSIPRRKRAWFSGLWANASAPPVVQGLRSG